MGLGLLKNTFEMLQYKEVTKDGLVAETNLNGLIDYCAARLKENPQELKIVGEPFKVRYEGGRAQSSDRFKITITHDEDSKLIEKTISIPISGNQRKGYLEPVLEPAEDNLWKIKKVVLNIPGQYTADLK